MKTKTSNKLNIVLVIITLLLIFVAGASAFGKTNSWLTDTDEIGFVVNVADIDIVVKQNARQIENGGQIYLGTDVLEGGKTYDLNVTITNSEDEKGYYIRCQAFAVIDGTTYNINNCITNDLNRDGTWMYVYNTSTNARRQMAGSETLYVIDTLTFTANFVNGLQGKYFKLYLYIEGSPVSDFSI